MNTIIITTDRDRLSLEYLRRVAGDAAISAAVAALQGARKPFVSNIAKQLKIEIPTDLQPETRTEKGAAGVAAARALLAKLKGKTP